MHLGKGLRLVTFDVYMALLDIQGTLTPLFAEACGVGDDRAGALVALWRARQMERAASSNSLAGAHTPFRDCTAMALDHVCRRHGLALSASRRTALIEAWGSLRPWPEADAALAAVRSRGLAIAILSNGDQATLEAVAAGFTTPFDHVLSAATAGHYKPHPAVYELPRARLGIPVEATLHVAGSANDVLGAIAFGMRCVWSNRGADVLLDPAFEPTHEIADLGALADLL